MSIEETVRDFWATRPRRRTDDRKVAGVAAAIGRRYGIDPVLVRVAFVVALVLGGVGMLLYLLGWLLFPAEADAVSAAESLFGRGHSSTSPALTVLLIIALILTAGVVFGESGFGIIGLAVAGAAMFLLHRYRAALGEVPVGVNPPRQSTDPSTQRTDPVTQQTDPTTSRTDPLTQRPTQGNEKEAAAAKPGHPAPPAWDPLGAAPFAWDLPEPGHVPPREPPPPQAPRSKVTPITVGCALLVGGIASALWPMLTVAQIAALVLAVIGFGLIVGSLVQGGRGLIAIALPLALLTWVLQAIPVSSFEIGERRWTPITPAELQQHYDLSMGSGVLDLTGLELTDGQTMRTAVATGVGEIKVLLPPKVDALVSCRVPVGAVDCLGKTSSGIPAQVDNVRDNGLDGPGGGRLVLDARVGTGNVLVQRGFGEPGRFQAPEREQDGP